MTDHSNTFSGESIQKMLANLPAKRATRKVLQDSMMRSQGRLRNVSNLIVQNNVYLHLNNIFNQNWIDIES